MDYDGPDIATTFVRSGGVINAELVRVDQSATNRDSECLCAIRSSEDVLHGAECVLDGARMEAEADRRRLGAAALDPGDKDLKLARGRFAHGLAWASGNAERGALRNEP